jgi:hypothetical protein
MAFFMCVSSENEILIWPRRFAQGPTAQARLQVLLGLFQRHRVIQIILHGRRRTGSTAGCHEYKNE